MTAKRSGKRVASVRDYVASKPKESRASLEAVRRAILKALPNAQEGLAYQTSVDTQIQPLIDTAKPAIN